MNGHQQTGPVGPVRANKRHHALFEMNAAYKRGICLKWTPELGPGIGEVKV
jgi:hypothetical protein